MGVTTKEKIKKICISKGFLIFLFVFLVVIIFFRPAYAIYINREALFFPNYDESRYKSLHKLYYSSQYVQKEKPTVIPDNILESFAGGAFLKGMNPILIVHDQPPLGRYITSLAILLFRNSTAFMAPMMVLSGLGIYFIGLIVMRNRWLSLIPAGIFANEPLFLSKLTFGPLIEIMQLPFIIFAIYFFLRGITGNRYVIWFILTSLMLGFVISIRFFVVGGGIVAAMLIFLLLERHMRKRLLAFVLSLPLALGVLIASYARTIQEGYSVLQIFGIQKYILTYQSSKFILPFTFWDLLLFNRWHTWWGDRSISFDPQWTLLWPISTILSFVFFLLGVIKKVEINNPEKVIFLWLGAICLMLSTGFTSTRYFLPIVPFFYILATSLLYKIFIRSIFK